MASMLVLLIGILAVITQALSLQEPTNCNGEEYNLLRLEMRRELAKQESKIRRLNDKFERENLILKTKLEKQSDNAEPTPTNSEKPLMEMNDLMPIVKKPAIKSEQSGDLSRNQGNRLLSFGCVADSIPLSCSDGRTINITSAYYGQYHETCAEGCCIPHPTDDCVEYVPASSMSEWLTLQATGDNETSCNYEYRGQSFAENCTVGQTADYINIYYACLPEDTDSPVAFTARPIESASYEEDDHIIFNNAVLNIGRHYQEDASLFICPVTGIYLFSLSILTQYGGLTHAAINIETSSPIGTAVADQVTSHHSQGAMTGFATCTAGQRVWIRYRDSESGAMHSGVYCVFSGSLMHMYG